MLTDDSEAGEDGGEDFEQRDAARDTRRCWCGRERLRIRIVYTDDWRGVGSSNEPADEPGTVRLRWPEDSGAA